jgi:acetyltransferase
MEFFFNPKGVALIGATAKPDRGGFSILKNLLKGFSGKISRKSPVFVH